MPEITSLMSLVERIIERAEDGTLMEGFEESIQRGSATGHICVVRDGDEADGLLLIVRLAIMRCPSNDPAAFHQRLLRLNHALRGKMAFSVSDDEVVYLTAGRNVEDLDPGEIIDLILGTSQEADNYDDLLLTEFGEEYAL